jgi:hypothetical protein
MLVLTDRRGSPGMTTATEFVRATVASFMKLTTTAARFEMKNYFSIAFILATATPVLAAPPPELRPALEQWAAPRSIARYQFSLVDLNKDGTLDAVVHVTDPAFCGNGGCPVVTFKRASAGFELVGSSGMVRKPIYVLNELQAGWHTLAAVAGFGNAAGVVPIRFKEQQGTYRSAPQMNAHIDLKSPATKQALEFEEAL